MLKRLVLSEIWKGKYLRKKYVLFSLQSHGANLFSCEFPFRFEEEIADYADCHYGRDIRRYVSAERVKYHYDSQERHGVHRAVLEVLVFLHVLNVADGYLPHNYGDYPVSYEYQGD